MTNNTFPFNLNGEILSSRQRLDRRQNDAYYYKVEKILAGRIQSEIEEQPEHMNRSDFAKISVI